MKKSILIVNDDLDVCKLVKYNLQNESTEVYYAWTALEGLQNFMRYSYTLVIMDIALSETDGLELLETMRRSKNIPILVLSGQCSTEDKVRALNAGADDFLSRPFEMDECFARVQALMRRYTELCGSSGPCYTLVFGLTLVIEPQCRKAMLGGKPLDLTRKEFDILYYLASNAGQVLTREQIYVCVWKEDNYTSVDELVRYHVQGLRKKLDGNSDSPYVETVWGVGYRFIPRDNR